jgi:hypothetical protein
MLKPLSAYQSGSYLGPGFFLALGATAALIAATIFVWRDEAA